MVSIKKYDVVMINNKKKFLLNLSCFYLGYLSQRIIIIKNEAGLKFEGKNWHIIYNFGEEESIITIYVFLEKISLRILRKHFPEW